MVHFRNFVLFLWTLHLSSVVRTSGEGQPRVFGSLQPIVAAPGDDVILPCHLEPSLNVEGLTVEWSRPELKPDPSDRLSRVEYVHLYRDRREVPDMKIQSYVGRTALFADGLKRGNISLQILNITKADEGKYKCFIPKLKGGVKSSVITLVIDPNFVKTWTTEAPEHPQNPQTPDPSNKTNVDGGRSHLGVLIPVVIVAVFVLAAVGVGGYSLKHKYQKQNYDSILSKPLPA